MKHHDHRASSKEEKSFEKRVGKQVKHGRVVRGETDSHHHVTKLRQR
jgi:hypothetical protein